MLIKKGSDLKENSIKTLAIIESVQELFSKYPDLSVTKLTIT